MKIIVNGSTVVIPTSLSEVTLKQRIEFQNQVGNDLDTMLKSILEIKDEVEREIETVHFNIEKMFRSMAFYIGCTVEALKEYENVEDLANIYFASMAQIFEQEQQMIKEPKTSFLWNDVYWYLDVPELKNGSKMTFGEFIDSKQTVQDLINLGKGKWECMLRLCAIFLRKENEVYEESFLYEDSERLKLMESLPLDIALQVGFFLNSSLNTYIEFSQSFTPQGLSQQEDSQKSTLKNLDGSIS